MAVNVNKNHKFDLNLNIKVKKMGEQENSVEFNP